MERAGDGVMDGFLRFPWGVPREVGGRSSHNPSLHQRHPCANNGFHLLSTYHMPDPKSCIALTSIVPLSPRNLHRSEVSPHFSFEEVETHRH